MAVRTIVEWPSKVLETPAKPVETFGDELRALVADMHETMAASGGIGLAANQIAVLQRVLVINIPFAENRYEGSDGGSPSGEPSESSAASEEKRWWHNKAFTFVNPRITQRSGKIRWQEGCLSFPEIFEFVDRAELVTVEAFDEHGEPFAVEADGLFSVCLQHEIDHIDGVVFMKRMSRLKSALVRKKAMRRAHQRLAETAETT